MKNQIEENLINNDFERADGDGPGVLWIVPVTLIVAAILLIIGGLIK